MRINRETRELLAFIDSNDDAQLTCVALLNACIVGEEHDRRVSHDEVKSMLYPMLLADLYSYSHANAGQMARQAVYDALHRLQYDAIVDHIMPLRTKHLGYALSLATVKG